MCRLRPSAAAWWRRQETLPRRGQQLSAKQEQAHQGASSEQLVGAIRNDAAHLELKPECSAEHLVQN